MRYIRFLFLISLLLLSGCAIFKGLSSQEMQRVVAADYDTTFDAVVEYLEDEGYPVVSSEQEIGYISTDYWTNPAPAAVDADLSKTRLTVFVHRKDENLTQVKLYFAKFDGRGSRGYFEAAVVAEHTRPLYQGILDAIEVRVTQEEGLHG